SISLRCFDIDTPVCHLHSITTSVSGNIQSVELIGYSIRKPENSKLESLFKYFTCTRIERYPVLTIVRSLQVPVNRIPFNEIVRRRQCIGVRCSSFIQLKL